MDEQVASSDDSHSICVYEKGSASSRHAIILLHGRTWSSLPVFDLAFQSTAQSGEGEVNLSTMDMLASEDLRVFAIDFRGFGGTLRDSSGWLTPQRAVSDVRSVVDWLRDSLGVTRPGVLGWSQGGLVAQLYAQLHPASISSLVLYATIYDPSVIYPRLPFLSKSAVPLYRYFFMYKYI